MEKKYIVFQVTVKTGATAQCRADGRIFMTEAEAINRVSVPAEPGCKYEIYEVAPRKVITVTKKEIV